MKAIRALELLKKHDFVHPQFTLRDLKQLREVMFSRATWEDVIKGIMMSEYLVGTRDLSEPIIVPEVKLAIGGTLDIHTGELE